MKETKKHYIAQVGEMWVDHCWSGIGKIGLIEKKIGAIPLNELDANWVKEKAGAKLYEVTVTITEEEK